VVVFGDFIGMLCTDFGKFCNLQQFMQHKSVTKKFCQQIKSLCSLERSAFLDAESERIIDALEKADVNGMHASVKRILSISKSKNKVIKNKHVQDSSGKHCQSVVEEKNAFRDYFGNLLNGYVRSFETLVYKDRFPSETRFSDVNVCDVKQNMPSQGELAAVYARSKKGKMPGRNNISPNVFHVFPTEMSRIHFR